eukprot:gene1711-1062_t
MLIRLCYHLNWEYWEKTSIPSSLSATIPGPHCMLALAKQLRIKCNYINNNRKMTRDHYNSNSPPIRTKWPMKNKLPFNRGGAGKAKTVALLLRILFLRFFLFYVFPPLLSFSQPTQNINPHTYFVNVTFNLYTQLTFISLNVFSLLISHPLLFNTFHL